MKNKKKLNVDDAVAGGRVLVVAWRRRSSGSQASVSFLFTLGSGNFRILKNQRKRSRKRRKKERPGETVMKKYRLR